MAQRRGAACRAREKSELLGRERAGRRPLARAADVQQLGLELRVAGAEKLLLRAHRLPVDAACHFVARGGPVPGIAAPDLIEGAHAEARLDDGDNGVPALLERKTWRHAPVCAGGLAPVCALSNQRYRLRRFSGLPLPRVRGSSPGISIRVTVLPV